MSSLHEECGVFGLYSNKPFDVKADTYLGLFALQHRGQESCGIVINQEGNLKLYKDVGLVSEVFTPEVMNKLPNGTMAVSHVRYGTTGITDRNNAQPMLVNHVRGQLALAHNGNLTNAYELRNNLELKGSIFHTTSDTEVISYIITEERLNTDSIEEAILKAMDRIEGAYSLVIMTQNKLVAVRDPHGFRPLCYGYREKDNVWVVASESCALDTVGATFIRDVNPGEIIVFDERGITCLADYCNRKPKRLCIFEYIYFARPDSVIDGSSVHEARVRAGSYLALEHPVQADVVIGVPDSGLDAAIGFSIQSGIPYEIGLIKNKYIARTFIAPGSGRGNKVKIKLNAIRNVVEGKRVVLVDDSIVRGTTCARIVALIREAGAKEVHMRISAPPFTNPCYYGTDIDSKEHLIACHHSIDEISKLIGADSLGYLSVDNVCRIPKLADPSTSCTACFSGVYPTKICEGSKKLRFEEKKK